MGCGYGFVGFRGLGYEYGFGLRRRSNVKRKGICFSYKLCLFLRFGFRFGGKGEIANFFKAVYCLLKGDSIVEIIVVGVHIDPLGGIYLISVAVYQFVRKCFVYKLFVSRIDYVDILWAYRKAVDIIRFGYGFKELSLGNLIPFRRSFPRLPNTKTSENQRVRASQQKEFPTYSLPFDRRKGQTK